MKKGIKIIQETIGDGPIIEKGNKINIAYTLSLSKGDVIQNNYVTEIVLGDRNIIAGLNYGIEGMRVNGIRKFKVSPHLAYRDKGTDKVPPNAVLIYDVKILNIHKS